MSTEQFEGIIADLRTDNENLRQQNQSLLKQLETLTSEVKSMRETINNNVIANKTNKRQLFNQPITNFFTDPKRKKRDDGTVDSLNVEMDDAEKSSNDQGNGNLKENDTQSSSQVGNVTFAAAVSSAKSPKPTPIQLENCDVEQLNEIISGLNKVCSPD